MNPATETSRDPRPLVRVFLASSQDLAAEREHFEEMIGRIARSVAIARQCKLEPVHWQQAGGDTEGRSIQGQIQQSVRFDEIAIVLVLVGHYLGQGTRSEYEAAKDLRKRHGSWPKLLVFFKADDSDVRLIGDESVILFQRDVIADGLTVPINFRNQAELEERLGEQLSTMLVSNGKRDRLAGEQLRRFFLASAWLGIALSAALILTASTMAFPDNGVSDTKVLFILVGPPLLFIVSAVTVWLLARLVNEFIYAWHSEEYADLRIYAVFRRIFPMVVIPTPMRDRFPHDALGDAIAVGMLLLVFVAPVAAQYNCIFAEFLTWDFVVEPQVLAEGPSPTESTRDNPVHSRYVEAGPLHWPYAPKTIPVYDNDGRPLTGPIFVYSRRGNLGSRDDPKWGQQDAFRMNIGPEVFLPLQPLLYLFLLALQTLAAVGILVRIVLLGRLVRGAHLPS